VNANDVSARRPQAESPLGERLDSWKEIASYLDRSVRTVKRWEHLEGLPVRRHQHKRSSSVYAYTSELDAWAAGREPQLDGEACAQADAQGPAVAAASRLPRWRAELAALGIAAIILTAGAYVVWQRLRASPAPATATLAVLPMVNLSGDPHEEYFSDGLTEEMIAELGGLEPMRLSVLARTSAMHYKHTRKRIDQIARELGADYVLEGSVRRVGERVRITAQLVDARTQRHLWAEHYDREARDVLRVQSEVVRAIRQAISAQLLEKRESPRLSIRRRPNDPEAFQLYLRGRYEWNKRTAEGFQKALDHFTAAIERDPVYAGAYAGLADTYAVMGSAGMMPIRESHPRGRAAALKALEIDETLGEAHAALATIITDYYWDWAEAERRFRRAIELNPSYATARHWFSFYLGDMGRFDEALAEAKRARELDPLSLVVDANVGLTYFRARRYHEAIAHLQRTVAMNPQFGFAHLCLGLAYLQNAMVEQAILEFQAGKKLSGLPNLDGLIGYANARSGRRREAEKILANLQEYTSARVSSDYEIALVYTALGDPDGAFNSLDQAIDTREWFVGMLRVDPLLDPLRSDPRYEGLLRRVGLLP
jgi:TolB-like protein/Tfp pilus assembly protein PilF